MRKGKRILFKIIALFLIISVIGGCAQKSNNDSKKTEESTNKIESENKSNIAEKNSSKELKTVNMGYNPNTGNILGFIAIDSGIAEEEGIDLELISFTNSTDALNALQAKKIDVGVSFGTIAPLTFVSQGADFSIFGGYVSGGMPVYAKPDIEYNGMETFLGKKVAVARMYTPDVVWRGAMYRAGYDPEKDCEIIEFKKPTDVLAAVTSGKADIGIGTNSTYLQAVEAGLKILTWTNDLDPMHVCCRPVANNSWLNEDEDRAKHLLRAWIRAEDILLRDPEYCVKLNEKYMGLTEEESKKMLLETNQVFESDPKTKGIEYMWDMMGKLNYADTSGVDISKHMNKELYKEALDELIKEYPDNENFKKFEERFKEYNE